MHRSTGGIKAQQNKTQGKRRDADRRSQGERAKTLERHPTYYKQHGSNREALVTANVSHGQCPDALVLPKDWALGEVRPLDPLQVSWKYRGQRLMLTRTRGKQMQVEDTWQVKWPDSSTEQL